MDTCSEFSLSPADRAGSGRDLGGPEEVHGQTPSVLTAETLNTQGRRCNFGELPFNAVQNLTSLCSTSFEHRNKEIVRLTITF